MQRQSLTNGTGRDLRTHQGSETEELEDGKDIGEESEGLDEEGNGEEQQGVGVGRYPSRSRARVEHYNPSLLDQQHRARQQRRAVRQNLFP